MGDAWDEDGEFEEAPTRVDGLPPLPESELTDTAKHNSVEYLAGREAGLTAGMEAAKRALIVELKKAGFTAEEIAAVTTRVSQAALDRA